MKVFAYMAQIFYCDCWVCPLLPIVNIAKISNLKVDIWLGILNVLFNQAAIHERMESFQIHFERKFNLDINYT